MLETRSPPFYHSTMEDVLKTTPPGWLIEALDRSEAQIASGQTVPLEPVLDRLKASIARMSAQVSPDEAPAARKA
jgi:hypothetical protein